MNIRLALIVIILCAVFAAAQRLTTTQPTVVCDTTTLTNCANVTGGAMQVGGTVTANSAVNSWGGSVDTNNGITTANTLRVVLSTGQTNLSNPLNVTLPNTSNVALTQIGATAAATVSAGILKVGIVDSMGNNILATADPCSGSNVANFSVATTSTTGVTLVAGTASTATYICGIHIHGNTANDTVAVIIEGTGADCTGGTPTVLDGSSTTASNGFRVAGGGGGFTAGYGGAMVYKTPTATGRNVCGAASTADRLIWSGTYIKQ